MRAGVVSGQKKERWAGREPPGDMRASRFIARVRDLIWETLYAPLAAGVLFTATRLNSLQFLTIRRYLSLVFATLVTLLLVLAIWS